MTAGTNPKSTSVESVGYVTKNKILLPTIQSNPDLCCLPNKKKQKKFYKHLLYKYISLATKTDNQTTIQSFQL